MAAIITCLQHFLDTCAIYVIPSSNSIQSYRVGISKVIHFIICKTVGRDIDNVNYSGVFDLV